MRVAQAVRPILFLVATTAALLWAPPACAALKLDPAFSGTVSQPMFVTAPPGDSHRLFVVSRSGVIRVAVDGVLQSTPFLDISSEVITSSNEGGLLSMAFEPGYDAPASPGYGLFYVYFVAPKDAGSMGGDILIEEFSSDPVNTPNVANATGRPVLEIPHDDADNHYGGTMQFNPVDGLLYIATGDGGASSANAQDTKQSLLGKLLRINPHAGLTDPYSIPPTNPFSGQPLCNPPSGTTDCPEIMAYGLRNPFRWSFDRSTGDIVIGDVGQSAWEEVNYVAQTSTLAGANFGWPCREGPAAHNACTANPRIDPVFSYDHSAGGSVAITGGVVVRDPALKPLVGRYLYADFFVGRVHSLDLGAPFTSDRVETDLAAVPNLVAFGEDAVGHVYVVSLSGFVYKLSCDCPDPPVDPGSPPPPPADNETPPSQQSPSTESSPTPEATPAVADKRPPVLVVRAARLQDVLRRGVLRLSIACDEACFARATARARGLGLRGVLRHLEAGEAGAFELRASARIRRALAKRGVVSLTVRGRDAAGNLTTQRLTVAVRR
ncbi:MAG: hypothetical protein QOJ29_3697 [Thermoleophilaceae bacterium]|nr:hypothetical protein [Thermoleophilaceae bacterium]